MKIQHSVADADDIRVVELSVESGEAGVYDDRAFVLSNDVVVDDRQTTQ